MRPQIICFCVCVVFVANVRSEQQPNIVILLADDLGSKDIGCDGGPVKTPALDGLAAKGVRFTDFHSGAPVCSPARATLLTGRHHLRTGVYTVIQDHIHNMHLRKSETTIAEVLKANGYDTVHLGKWHLGTPFRGWKKPWIDEHGFDYWFATDLNAAPSHRNPINFWRNRERVGELKGYACQLVVDEAITWLDEKRAAEKPFFLNIWFHEPHAPLAAPDDIVSQYGELNDPAAIYSGTVDNTDRAIARLLKKLEQIGSLENTIIIYTSDHGSYRHERNGELRGSKGSLLEGGIRTPGIIHWPKGFKGGRVEDTPAGAVDLLPTICGLVGIEKPNIIFFFTDDHGWRDSEPYGNPYIKTPNMTRLAKESMQFMHAYAASPLCSPSRSTVVTGLMPHRCGAHYFGNPIARNIKVMSGYFNEAGYHTVSAGKDGFLQWGWGFSSPRGSRYTQGIGDVDRADEYIRNYKGEKPLFMYIGCGPPHQPWQKNKIYEPEKIPLPPNFVDTPEMRLSMADYYQDVTVMDEKLGKVLDALDAREDLKKNTLFVFSTDQGAHLPFGKWNLYDAGLRVPFMASWPGVIEPGSKTESMISLADVLPTFLEVAGESIPDGLDGKSFLPVLKDGSQKHRDVVFGTHTGNSNGPEYNHNNNPMRTIRTPTHRYIFNLEPDRLFNTSFRKPNPLHNPVAVYKSWQEKAKADDFAKRVIQDYEYRPADELYDLEADPYEMNNLADDPKHAELLKSLKAQVTEWCKTQDDVEALKTLDPNFAPAASQRPNIVFILSDDQAWTDYGFMGHPDIKTPHLDKLASRSLVFERGYVASPLCRPSLASLATGLYPFQHGITGNDVGSGGKDRAALDAPMKAAFHKHPSFIKMLTSNGYLAHQSGKWWEGSYQDGGFTHGMTHGDPERKGRHGDLGLNIGRRSMKPVTDFIDLATEEKKPFMLWYAPFLPHTPHNPPQRLLEKYTKPGQAEDVAKYYAMCEWFDETCGQLLGYLDKKNLTEDTMVIYICDNGWAAASTNASDPNQKLWKGFALRSKGSPYENGIRTPIMISWPGHVQPGSTMNKLAHAIDIFPTIAAATGLKAPENLQGINLLDALARVKRKAIFGVTNSIQDMTPGGPNSTLQYLWCINGNWKLLVRYDGKDTTRYRNLHVWDTAPVRLYNLKIDPHEKNDRAGANPELVERMRKKIEAWHLVKGK